MFPFEKLNVYQKSLDIVANVHVAFKQPVVNLAIKDQITRASLSIPLNIAEGYGRWSFKDRNHFFRVARGSVFEVVPLIQIMKRIGIIDPEIYNVLYRDLNDVGKMLSGLMKNSDYDSVKKNSD